MRLMRTIPICTIVLFVVLGLGRWAEAGSLVIRYDAGGQIEWTQDHEGDSAAEKVDLDDSGNTYVNLYDHALVVDPQGETLWQQVFPMFIEDFVVTGDGFSYWDCSDGEGCTIKLDTGGQPIWDVALEGSSVLNFVLREDDTPYVLTYCDEIEDNSRCLARLSEDGEILWTTWLEKPEPYDVAAADLKLGPDGSVYVFGWLSGSSDHPGVVYRYNEDGEMVWQTKLDDVKQPEVFVVDDLGNSYVPYGKNDLTDEVGMYLKKLNVDGTEEWTRAHDLGAYHAVSAIDVNSQREIAVSCCDDTYHGEAATITVFDGTGQLRWTGQLEEEVACFRSVFIADDGAVIATGGVCEESEEEKHDCRMVTAKFDSNGNLLWIDKYDSDNGDQEEGQSLAVAADGDVIVAGGYVAGAEEEEDDAGCGC